MFEKLLTLGAFLLLLLVLGVGYIIGKVSEALWERGEE